MHRLRLLCSALLILAATNAHAGQGVNLRWSSCFGDGGVANRDFACNTNAGSNVLVGSFQLGSPLQHVVGQRIGLDLNASSATLPEWWTFRNAGTCRQLSLSVSFFADPAAVNCADWSSGQALGGIGAYLVGLHGPSSARVFMTQAVQNELAVDLDPGMEYVAFNLTINNAKTVGSGACGGCSVPVCLVLNYIELTTISPPATLTLNLAANGTNSHFATWQGPVPVPPGGHECPWPVPVRRETWGAVKSLYR
jgi:hypothetical protein